jgi:hypothetical protein
MDAEFTAELRPDDRDHLDAMPAEGIPADEIRKMMQATGKAEDQKWLEGKVRRRSAARAEREREGARACRGPG